MAIYAQDGYSKHMYEVFINREVPLSPPPLPPPAPPPAPPPPPSPPPPRPPQIPLFNPPYDTPSTPPHVGGLQVVIFSELVWLPAAEGIGREGGEREKYLNPWLSSGAYLRDPGRESAVAQQPVKRYRRSDHLRKSRGTVLVQEPRAWLLPSAAGACGSHNSQGCWLPGWVGHPSLPNVLFLAEPMVVLGSRSSQFLFWQGGCLAQVLLASNLSPSARLACVWPMTPAVTKRFPASSPNEQPQ